MERYCDRGFDEVVWFRKVSCWGQRDGKMERGVEGVDFWWWEVCVMVILGDGSFEFGFLDGRGRVGGLVGGLRGLGLEGFGDRGEDRGRKDLRDGDAEKEEDRKKVWMRK